MIPKEEKEEEEEEEISITMVMMMMHGGGGGDGNEDDDSHNKDSENENENQDENNDDDDDWNSNTTKKRTKMNRRRKDVPRLLRWLYSYSFDRIKRRRRRRRKLGALRRHRGSTTSTTNPATAITYGVVVIVVVVIIIIMILVVFMMISSSSSSSTNPKQSLRRQIQQKTETETPLIIRILYIVTSSVEYDSVVTTTTTTATTDNATSSSSNTDRRKRDRFMEILVPVVQSSVQSIKQMMSMSISSKTNNNDKVEVQVDVYLVLGYQLSLSKLQQLRNVLPSTSGIEVWNDSTPIYYEFSSSSSNNNNNNKNARRVPYLGQMKRTLARQHRYVVKDKLPYYHTILAMEDDMLVTSQHVSYHWQFRKEQYRWIRYIQQQKRRQKEEEEKLQHHQPTTALWFDNLSIEQWKRVYPAWIRVEVMEQQKLHQQQQKLHQQHQQQQNDVEEEGNEVQYVDRQNGRFDPYRLMMCCHHFHHHHQQHFGGGGGGGGGGGDSGDRRRGGTNSTVIITTPEQLVVWETGIDGFSARKLPPVVIDTATTTTTDLNNNKRHSLLSRLTNLAILRSMSSSSGSSSLLASEEATRNNTILSPSTWVALIDPSSAVDAATVPLSHRDPIHRARRYTLAGYWSGSYGGTDMIGHHFDNKPPSSRENHFFANPAGWIATTKEIYDWHSEFCPSNTFLPPFGKIWKGSSSVHRTTSMMVEDGMDSTSDYVEYWSGGMQLFGQAVCGIQRFVNIDHFGEHLIYHTANNKQHDLPSGRFVESTTLLDQLNKMSVAAEQDYLTRLHSISE